MARTGRRRGNSGTREAILAAAREAFAEHGYDGASIRQIAAAAGVDPALVHHYFGSKDDLFVATLEVPFNPAAVLSEVLGGGLDGVGERLVRVLLGIWDGAGGKPALALLRTMVRHEWGAALMRDFVTSQILRRAAAQYDIPDAEARLPLVGSQVIGLVLIRYVLRVEPLASAPTDWVAGTVGPTIQRYLTAPLPELAASG